MAKNIACVPIPTYVNQVLVETQIPLWNCIKEIKFMQAYKRYISLPHWHPSKNEEHTRDTSNFITIGKLLVNEMLWSQGDMCEQFYAPVNRVTLDKLPPNLVVYPLPDTSKKDLTPEERREQESPRD